MKAFAACLRTAAAASVDLSDKGFGSRAGVRDALDRTRMLLEAQAQLGPQYDEKRFRELVVSTIPLDQVRPTDIDRYLAGMAAYKVKEEEIEKAVAELKAQAAANEQLVRASAPEKKEAAAFENKLTIVNDFHIARFRERKFIEMDFVSGEFAKAKNDVAAEIATLKGFVRMEDVDQWLARLEPLGVPSRELTNEWETWKETLAQTATQLAGQRQRILELQEETRQLQDVLLEFNRSVPQAPTLDDEVLARAADVKREEVLASLLKDRAAVRFARQNDPVRMVQESEAVGAARAAYQQWTRDLTDLGKDFPLRPRILTPDVRPDEQWAAAKPEFWNDRIVQTVVAADVERLRRMRALGDKPREELVKTARDEGREELALHAWRLLGAGDASPPWPTAPGELATEAALRRRLATLLTPHARTDESAAAAVREIEQEGARRWRQFAEAAGVDEAMLASAVELRDAFGIDAEDFASLAPEARFNLSLLEARRHGGGDDADAALSRVVAELKAAAGQLKDRTVAAGLARRLARIDEKESFPDAARGDEFVLKPQGAPDVQIVFRRVRPAGGRPCFLATTELSFGHVAAVVDAAAGWDDLRSLVWSPQPGDIGDPRRGPRSWEWVMRPAPRMYPPQWWLFPEDANDFPKELRDPAAGRFNRTVLSDAAGGRPSDAHPMQYVTPEAAMYVASLAGCRLPTPAEWRAAFDESEKAVPTGDWNLRDQTWQIQQRHVASIAVDGGASGAGAHAPPAPDEGIYLPPQPVVARGAAARALPHRDGALFFRPADAAGGATFRQLVGNVAELVCEASEGFEQLKDRRPLGIKGFAAEAAAGLFVVGGSALSPPEAPSDVPLPVKPGAAYADVGFRLAFTAPSRNLAEKLQWVLAGQGFVKGVREDKTANTGGPPPVVAAPSPAVPPGTADKSDR
jgi:hypothetical protein